MEKNYQKFVISFWCDSEIKTIEIDCHVCPSFFVCVFDSKLFKLIQVNLTFWSLMKLHLINSPLFINLPR